MYRARSAGSGPVSKTSANTARGCVTQALPLFQERRTPPMKTIWDAANTSLRWYEEMDGLIKLDPVDFAYSYMTRTGRVDHAEVRRRDPALADAYERLHGAQGAV